MSQNNSNPLFNLLESTFDKSTVSDIEIFRERTRHETKWVCLTDYCLDDPNKPNNVISITLLPFLHDHEQLVSSIRTVANKDIKHTRRVSSEFIDILSNYPMIHFSFLLVNRTILFGKKDADRRKSLKETFEHIRNQYKEWTEAEPEKKDHYDKVTSKLKCILHKINGGKSLKEVIAMVLVTYLSAYVSSKILKDRHIEIFGWLSDRDAINDICDNASIDLFQYYLHGLTNMNLREFVAAPAGSQANPFYEELVRIPDYIAGTLADYHLDQSLVSKDKFVTMLRDYIADNMHNNFVFKLSVEDTGFHLSRIVFKKSQSESES